MLEIRGLTAAIDDKPILQGHRPHGAARARCTPSWGRTAPANRRSPTCCRDARTTRSPAASVTFDGRDLLAMDAGGARRGRPVPGVPVPGRTAGRRQRQLPAHRAERACAARAARAKLDAVQFLKLARAETKRLAMPDDMLKRNVNVGFSGGEKKRNEVLQMAILRPRLAILDETDSGLRSRRRESC